MTPLDAMSTRELLRLARQWDVSLTAVFAAAAQFAAAAVAMGNGSGGNGLLCGEADPNKVPVSLFIPVNLRPFCKPGVNANTLRAYLSSIHLQAVQGVEPSTPFWSLAQCCHAQMSTLVNQCGEQIGILRFVTGSWVDLQKRFCTRPPHGRRFSVEVSNVGYNSGAAGQPTLVSPTSSSAIRLLTLPAFPSLPPLRTFYVIRT